MLKGLLMKSGNGAFQPSQLEPQGIGHIWWQLRDGTIDKDGPDIEVFRDIVTKTSFPYGFTYTLDYVSKNADNGGLPQARKCWDVMDKFVAYVGRKPIGLALAFLPIPGYPLPTDQKNSYVNNLIYFYDEWVAHYGAAGRPILLTRQDMLNYLGTIDPKLIKCPLMMTDFNASPKATYGSWPQWAFNYYAGAEVNTVFSAYGQVRWPGDLASLKQWVIDRKTIPAYSSNPQPPDDGTPQDPPSDGDPNDGTTPEDPTLVARVETIEKIIGLARDLVKAISSY